MAQHIHHQACRGDIGTLCITSHVPGKEVREMHLPAFSAAALQSKAPDLPSFLPASAAFQGTLCSPAGSQGLWPLVTPSRPLRC
ncbi:uncharacterized protein LOC144335222 isoform X4 [Macaca mulatta]